MVLTLINVIIIAATKTIRIIILVYNSQYYKFSYRIIM